VNDEATRAGTSAIDQPSVDRGFRHEALLYSGDREFVAAVAPFIRDGVTRGDAVLVVVDGPKIAGLRAALDDHRDAVAFADTRGVGHNPARIMQTWRDFVAEHARAARACRGVGEPITARRSDAALAECHIHEALLNTAFAGVSNFWLLCPYDTSSLADVDVTRAVLNHPYVRDGLGRAVHGSAAREAGDPFGPALPPPPAAAETIPFEERTIRTLRETVARRARAAGVGDEKVAGLVLAVSEVATNTVVHGRGRGEAKVWIDDRWFLCELCGPGRITDPMVGRLRPTRGQMHGYGIWLANQLCDLVQIRSCENGTTVRLHLARAERGTRAS
jgi:anti-sigma regulatory factor (Ser/Thr protein kinase)